MDFTTNLKTIVVATDLSGRSDAALEYAAKLAGACGARIVLAHGLDPLDYAAVDAVPEAVIDHMTEEARAALDRMAAGLLRAGIRSHSEVRQGEVAEMLVEVALDHRAGLLVIGTRGMQGAGPVAVGSIAEQLVRMAPCPVLAVAADWNAGPHRPVPGGPVLLALERNAAAPAAAEAAYALAEIFQRPLLVIHARTTGADPGLNAEILAEFAIRTAVPVKLTYIVADGDVADAVVRVIDQYRPCILVAGVKRATHFPGPHGTAFALLSRSRVPVLCVPPDSATDAEEKYACAAADMV